jgi:16S rRNA G966 N2-methylase RsmD
VQRLKKNITALGVDDRARIIAGDLFRWFEASGAGDKVHVVFLDPPYRFLTERPDAVRRLAGQIASNHLVAEGVVVFRHDAQDALELPPLYRYDARTYGGMTVELLRAAGTKGESLARPDLQP